MTLAGERFYQIANFDGLRPFFLSVVSDSDHWLFIYSNGGLTAGRRDANLALFPYYTEDKLRDTAEATGSKTILRVALGRKTFVWEPLSERGRGIYRVRRNLYKNVWGNQLIFEEINDDLGLTYRYGWTNSRRFGFVRRVWLANSSRVPARVEWLDGVQNLMPCGVGSQFNLEYSTLLDAYKRSELLPGSGLGLFRLSAIPVDRPEPAEALRTNVAWSVGSPRRLTLLSSVQLDSFRNGDALKPETDVRAERGAYFITGEMTLRPGATRDWLLVADVNQGPSEIAGLDRLLRQPARLRQAVLQDVQRGTEELKRIVASADGLQQTAQPLRDARHYANTLFNIMRGGVFAHGYEVESSDLRAFVGKANRQVARRRSSFLSRLPPKIYYPELVAAAQDTGDAHLERICREYLPLTFSRRHGDPSRPWNRFSIATANADGSRSLNYEGNWRDIFQNWEALAFSFPAFTSGMICRFLNASTADGYNPYRITRDGIEWEIADPHDPWSHIGYWGDHQIIYLLKLLENLQRHAPEELRELLTRRIFAYANVPYRIKPYRELLANPKDTVVFDQAQEQLLRERVQAGGGDGKLLWDERGQVCQVNLVEKLVVPLLAKLSNFIPGAGIWLNTQRPEWNDANNALVGNGCSMVTLYYLRRYLTFFRNLQAPAAAPEFELSAEVMTFFAAIHAALAKHRPPLAGGISDQQRRRVLDDLGAAGSRYRELLYARGLSGRRTKLPAPRLQAFLATAMEWVNHTIASNRRTDGLYHAYNLVRFDAPLGLPIRRLYEMLEGQVAVLSSGALSAKESLRLLHALKRSAMYRADQHSYLLYPDRALPRFVEKNVIPPAELRRSRLLQKLLVDGNCQLVERDVNGRVHFHASITNARDVRRILVRFTGTNYAAVARRDASRVLEIFERVFDHESFTGRSGTFFGYEGLGCIYWHMVSKLLLAVQETYFRAQTAAESPAVLRGLAAAYHDIRAGLGDAKTPDCYGAFPMDPYSHTPGHAGARQPGLTGQVKEDFICRLGELGVEVTQGLVRFRPDLLAPSEFVESAQDFSFCDLSGTWRRWKLRPGQLAFTYCQTLIVMQMAPRAEVAVFHRARVTRRAGLGLDRAESEALLRRSGELTRIEVSFPPGALRRTGFPLPSIVGSTNSQTARKAAVRQ